jgi:SnoaL-like domain
MPDIHDRDEAALWYALHRLETSYWYDVDFNAGSKAHEFYARDGLFAVGDNQFRGHDKIRAFYAWRRQRGHTTTRHLINNLLAIRQDDNCALLTGVLSLYRADGRPPFQGERPPMLIADLSGDCVLGEDKVWRYQTHVLHPIFVGSDIPLSISIDTQILAENERGSRKQA